METRTCPSCGEEKPVSEFLRRKSGKGEGYFVSPILCRPCRANRMKEYRHKNGSSMSENKECPSFLGVYVAERVLAAYFKSVTKMPYGYPGFDFICGKGYKIDVKSSCLIRRHGRTKESVFYAWDFTLSRNQVADYFLCIGFDNRESLTPCHVWLIPGKLINTQYNMQIANNPKRIAAWKEYEHPIEEVIACCDKLKS